MKTGLFTVAPFVSIDSSSVRTTLAGYPWQNEGVATIENGLMVTFNHGCPLNPQNSLVITSTNAVNEPYNVKVDNTTATITVETMGNYTFYWQIMPIIISNQELS